MAPRGDDPDHKYAKERDRIKSSELCKQDTNAVLEFLAAFDPEDLSASYTNEKGEKETLSYNSLEGYGRALRLIGKTGDCDLLNHTDETIQAVFDEFLNDLAKKTVRQRQAAAIKFYRYHDGHDVDPDGIVLVNPDNDESVDERDMFTKEEIQELREACDNTRDRALLELLIYTGQRIRALQTLRVKDIDLNEGVYYLNADDLGLKGADRVGAKRPLLGAEKAVREWLKHHPTGEPDDYLITPLPSSTGSAGPGEYLSAPAIRNRLWKIAERADVYDRDTKEGKPPNPHNFRHYFVTVCYREYDMDPSTIKFLIGHGQESVVMETTYQHLTDEDHINAARASSGAGRDPEEQESSFTPETCPTCREPLPPNAKACPGCGMTFTPDAVAAEEQIEDQLKDSYREADPEDTETMEKLDMLDDLLDDPEVKTALLEKLND
jgi:integrase